MYTILAIDGGGIRGIIPGQVLLTLEEKLAAQVDARPELRELYKDRPVRLADFFDFFAGTSTGGILTCIYLCPDQQHPAQARFSAREAVDLYVEHGDEIFDIPLWKKIQSVSGLLDEKYDATELEKALRRYLNETRLSELLRPCLVTSYDIRKRRTHFFNQKDARELGDAYDFLLRDVCRATSAAPTYFEAAQIESLNGIAYPLIDGGIFANNPALCAYSEVRNMHPELTAEKMMIISLGTGSENRPYTYKEAKNWGAAEWVRPVIDIMMSGAAEVTNYHLVKMYEAVRRPHQYLRIQPTDLGDATADMDDARPQNIRALVQVGKETARNCNDQLDQLARILVEKRISDLGVLKKPAAGEPVA